MKQYFKAIISILVTISITTLILLFIYFFYERTVPIRIPDPHLNVWRTGEYYSKNNFNVFYEVKAFRGPDKNRWYDQKVRIQGADPETFQVLNRNYTKDKSNFYVCAYNGPDAFRLNSKCEKLKNIHSVSFYIQDAEWYDYYAQDKNNVYFYGKVVANADPESFRVLNHNFARDKNRIYYKDIWLRLHIVEENKYNSYITNGENISAITKELNEKPTAFMESFLQ